MAKKNLTNHRNEWTTADVRELKALAKAKTPTSQISAKLGRTSGAIYQKASTEGISLGGGRRAARSRRRR